MVLCGISQSFDWLSPTLRQIIHALLTRAPLVLILLLSPFDLHVLGTPPAFVLSQNQTLQFKFCFIPNKLAFTLLFVRIFLKLCRIIAYSTKSPKIFSSSYSVFKERNVQKFHRFSAARGTDTTLFFVLVNILFLFFSSFDKSPKNRKTWWRQQGSNLRPSECKSDALPTELCPRSGTGFRSGPENGQ